MSGKYVVVCCGAATLAVLAVCVQAQGPRQVAQQTRERVPVHGNIKNWSSTPWIKSLERAFEFFATPRESATLALRAGEFAVFAPGGAHRPSLHLDGPHVSRKAVVKVSVAYRDRQRAAKER